MPPGATVRGSPPRCRSCTGRPPRPARSRRSGRRRRARGPGRCGYSPATTAACFSGEEVKPAAAAAWLRPPPPMAQAPAARPPGSAGQPSICSLRASADWAGGVPLSKTRSSSGSTKRGPPRGQRRRVRGGRFGKRRRRAGPEEGGAGRPGRYAGATPGQAGRNRGVPPQGAKSVPGAGVSEGVFRDNAGNGHAGGCAEPSRVCGHGAAGIAGGIAPAVAVRDAVGVVARVQGQIDPAPVAGAVQAGRRAAGFLHGRPVKAEQDGEDGDHHQQLDPWESRPSRHPAGSRSRCGSGEVPRRRTGPAAGTLATGSRGVQGGLGEACVTRCNKACVTGADVLAWDGIGQ